MNDYRHMELSSLVDMLSEYTAHFSKMRTEGCSDSEFTSIKETIRLLQAEIETRKKKEQNKFADSGS
jgi:hypothetical protein